MGQPIVDTSLVSIAGAEHWAWTDGDGSGEGDLESRQQLELEADLCWLGQRCCEEDKFLVYPASFEAQVDERSTHNVSYSTGCEGDESSVIEQDS